MVELAVSLCVIMVLTAVAIPSFMRFLRTYQLNDAAGRVADILKFTRFEAVRRNTQIPLQILQVGNDWVVWADSNNNGVPDPTEKQCLLTGSVSLLPGGVAPNPGPITASLGVGGMVTMPGGGPFTFDARGAIRTGGILTPNVYVFFVGNAANPDYGYRAVVLLPAGGTHIWTTPAGGAWQKVN